MDTKAQCNELRTLLELARDEIGNTNVRCGIADVDALETHIADATQRAEKAERDRDGYNEQQGTYRNMYEAERDRVAVLEKLLREEHDVLRLYSWADYIMALLARVDAALASPAAKGDTHLIGCTEARAALKTDVCYCQSHEVATDPRNAQPDAERPSDAEVEEAIQRMKAQTCTHGLSLSADSDVVRRLLAHTKRLEGELKETNKGWDMTQAAGRRLIERAEAATHRADAWEVAAQSAIRNLEAAEKRVAALEDSLCNADLNIKAGGQRIAQLEAELSAMTDNCDTYQKAAFELRAQLAKRDEGERRTRWEAQWFDPSDRVWHPLASPRLKASEAAWDVVQARNDGCTYETRTARLSETMTKEEPGRVLSGAWSEGSK